MVTNTRELIGDVKTGSHLGCSDHALVEFAVLTDTDQAKSQDPAFQESKLRVVQGVSQEDTRETALRDKGAEQSGRSLRTLSIEGKSSRSPAVTNLERKARDQHG